MGLARTSAGRPLAWGLVAAEDPVPALPAWVAGAAVVVLVCLAYFPIRRAGFVWQDDVNVSANPLVRSPGGFSRIWTDPVAVPSPRPLAFTAFWAEYRLWGGWPAGYHAANVLLHASNCLVLGLLLRRLAVPRAWLAAGLFTMHPVQAPAVAWVSQQGMLLATMFSLVALLGYLGWAQLTLEEREWEDRWLRPGLPRHPVVRYAATLLLFLAAVLCHPAAAVWPAVAGAIVRWKKGSRLGRADVLPLVPFAILAGLAAWAAWAFPTDREITAAGGRWEAITASVGSGGAGPWLWLAKVIVPAPAVLHFDFLAGVPWVVAVGGWAMTVAAIVGLCRKRSEIGGAFARFGLLWLGCAAGLCAMGTLAERRDATAAGAWLYPLSAIPLALLCASVARLGRTHSAGTRLTPATAAALVVVPIVGLLFITTVSCGRYATAGTFWAESASTDAGEACALRHLGDLVLSTGSPAQRAVEHYEAALHLDPADADAALGLGLAYEKLDYRRLARETARGALATRPNDPRMLSLLARLDARDGLFDDAARHYAAAIAARADDPAVRNDFGLLLASRGSLTEAIAQYSAALAARPRYVPARLNLATALFRLGQLDEAAGQLQTVAKNDPDNFEAYVNAGAMLATMKRWPEAERMFRNAVALRHTSKEAWRGLAAALAAQGRAGESAWCLQRAESR